MHVHLHNQVNTFTCKNSFKIFYKSRDLEVYKQEEMSKKKNETKNPHHFIVFICIFRFRVASERFDGYQKSGCACLCARRSYYLIEDNPKLNFMSQQK